VVERRKDHADVWPTGALPTKEQRRQLARFLELLAQRVLKDEDIQLPVRTAEVSNAYEFYPPLEGVQGRDRKSQTMSITIKWGLLP
jgi:hypothetical protein